MTLALELGGVRDPYVRRAFEALSQQFPVTVTGGGGAPSGAASGDLGASYPGPTVVKAQSGFTVGGVAVILAGDAALTNSRPPNGAAGGDLAGSFPNPDIAAGVIVNADVSATAAIAESKLSLATDAAAGTGSRRTIGTGALQATAGNDARLSDTRTPTALSVVDASVSATAAIAESKLNLATDAAAGTGSRRTLGTSATSAAAGNRGMPVGGTSGQTLTKNSGTDYDAGWVTPAGGGSVFYDAVQQGVLAAGDCALTVNSITQVTIAAGTVYVTASGVLARTGPTSTVLGSIPAASASNFRLDQIVMSTAGVVSRLAGTQGTTVTLTNRTGAAALGTSMLLHDVLVTSGGVLVANVRDRRTWARGAFWAGTRSSGDTAAFSSTSWAAIDSTNLQARIECTGVPVRVQLLGMGQAGTTGAHSFAYSVDGDLTGTSVSPRNQLLNVTAGTTYLIDIAWVFTPSAGSHLLFALERALSGSFFFFSGGANGGQIQFTVEELVRQNSTNGAT